MRLPVSPTPLGCQAAPETGGHGPVGAREGTVVRSDELRERAAALHDDRRIRISVTAANVAGAGLVALESTLISGNGHIVRHAGLVSTVVVVAYLVATVEAQTEITRSLHARYMPRDNVM